MSDTGNNFKMAILATGMSVTAVSLFHVVIKCLLDFIFADHVGFCLAVLLVLSILRYTSSREEIPKNLKKNALKTSTARECSREEITKNLKKNVLEISTAREKKIISLESSQSVEHAGEKGRLINGDVNYDVFFRNKSDVIDDVFIGNTSSVATNTSECNQVIVNSKHSNNQRIVQSRQDLMNERPTEGLSRQDVTNILGSRIERTDQSNNNKYEQSINQSEQKAFGINYSIQEIKNSAMNLGHVRQWIEKSVQNTEHTIKSRQKNNNTMSKSENNLTVEHLRTEVESSHQVIQKTEQRLTETKEATQEIRNTAQNESNTVQRIEDSLQTVTNSDTAREVIQTVKNTAVGQQASQIIRNTLQIVKNSKKVVQTVGN